MKSKRQKRILELIKQEPIGRQEELAAKLEKEGMRVTQATISRDIKELRLIKVARGENYAYSVSRGQMPMQDHSRLKRIFRDAVLKLNVSENLIVVHTLPGNANSVCSLMDGADWDEYLGGVAGDDTIIVVARSKNDAWTMMARMQGMLDM